MKNIIKDIQAMTIRSLKLNLRSVDSIVTAFVLPNILLLAFVFIFGGAIDRSGNYINYIVPGILVLGIGQIAAQTAVTVAGSKEEGVFKRFKVMNITQSAYFIGEMNLTILKMLLAMISVFVLAFFLGFDGQFQFLRLILMVVLMIIFTAVISWIGFYIGLKSSLEGAGGFTFAMIFLPYISSAFVPTATMPHVLQIIAYFSPFTWVIESFRYCLFANGSLTNVLLTIMALTLILSGMMVLTTQTYTKKS